MKRLQLSPTWKLLRVVLYAVVCRKWIWITAPEDRLTDV
jgi:hypothetical protein